MFSSAGPNTGTGKRASSSGGNSDFSILVMPPAWRMLIALEVCEITFAALNDFPLVRVKFPPETVVILRPLRSSAPALWVKAMQVRL